MPQTKLRTSAVRRRAAPPKIPKTVDEQMGLHLKEAEDHLVKAIELFSGHPKPSLGVEYLTRLSGAQEGVTAVRRAFLVLERGVLRPRKSK